MTQDDKAEIERLTGIIDRVRDDLRAERGQANPGEIIVRRYGEDPASPNTFHFRISIDCSVAAVAGAHYLNTLMAHARTVLEDEIKRRNVTARSSAE